MNRNAVIDAMIWMMLGMAAIGSISFLSGQSRAMDEQSSAQRLANFCQDNQMNMLCVGVKHGTR